MLWSIDGIIDIVSIGTRAAAKGVGWRTGAGTGGKERERCLENIVGVPRVAITPRGKCCVAPVFHPPNPTQPPPPPPFAPRFVALTVPWFFEVGLSADIPATSYVRIFRVLRLLKV